VIITKVIYGWVNQQFDTETRRFVGQEFRGSDERHWENEMGDELNMANENNRAAVYGVGGVDEPYLNMDMVQPLTAAQIEAVRKSIDLPQPLLAQATSFEVGETVLVTPLEGPTDIPIYEQITHEFMGKVIGIKDDRYVQVKDQDNDVFDCEPIQVHHVK
jgi:hypothetical protein